MERTCGNCVARDLCSGFNNGKHPCQFWDCGDLLERYEKLERVAKDMLTHIRHLENIADYFLPKDSDEMYEVSLEIARLENTLRELGVLDE